MSLAHRVGGDHIRPMDAPRPRSAVRRWAGAIARDSLDDRVYRPIRHEALIVAALVALAIVVRSLGMRLGLPYLHHWDEVYCSHGARSMVFNGNDLPSMYYYGAPLMRLEVLGFHIARFFGARWADVSVDDVALRWVGRAASVMICSSGVLALYLTGRFGSRRPAAALGGALVYAVAAELVFHARYAVTDGIMAALVAWAFGLTAAYLHQRSAWLAALAVLAAGLAFAFKLPGLTVVSIPTAALALRSPLTILRRARAVDLQAGGSSVLARLLSRLVTVSAVPAVLLIYLRLNPHLLPEWQASFSNLQFSLEQYRHGFYGPYFYRETAGEHLASALAYLGKVAFAMEAPVSLLLAGLGLAGLGLAVARRNIAVAILATHATAVLLFQTLLNHAFFTRAFVPLVPALCAGVGVAVAEIHTRTPPPRRRVVALTLALAAAAYVGLAVAQAWRAQALSVDPRMRALDWIERQATGRRVKVALAPTVARQGSAVGWGPGLAPHLERPSIAELTEVEDPARTRTDADYIVVASYHSPLGSPHQHLWPFTQWPGYREVARFAPSPYEYRLELTPTWDGNVYAVVLERQPVTSRASGSSSAVAKLRRDRCADR